MFNHHNHHHHYFLWVISFWVSYHFSKWPGFWPHAHRWEMILLHGRFYGRDCLPRALSLPPMSSFRPLPTIVYFSSALGPCARFDDGCHESSHCFTSLPPPPTPHPRHSFAWVTIELGRNWSVVLLPSYWVATSATIRRYLKQVANFAATDISAPLSYKEGPSPQRGGNSIVGGSYQPCLPF